MEWVHIERRAAHYKVWCDVCQETKFIWSKDELADFQRRHANHTASADWLGAGDVVKAAADLIGAKTCTPCERRRRLMNRMVPKVWKRR